MRYEFVLSTIQKLLNEGRMAKTDSVLAICASTSERRAFQELGFTAVTISNLDDRMTAPDFSPYTWSYQDAQALTFEDSSFDHVFVSDGLHHCDSPHRGLLEMYRVARKSIIVFESRDSALLRLSSRMGLVAHYEVEAVVDSGMAYGGVNNTPIPNFVYRWTEREFEKTIASFLPIGQHHFRYFYQLNLPNARVSMHAGGVKSLMLTLARPVAKLVDWFAPKQGNSFCMVAEKPSLPGDLWPWLEMREGKVVFRKAYSSNFKGSPAPTQST